ncbi:hypothetical protein BDZ91DRAFT_747557, partial [Kalaharituber pfeilii]
MALAAPVISDLLSLGSYAQDLYERCLLAPLAFREAKTELLALQTALTHLEFLTKSPLFSAGAGAKEGTNSVPAAEAIQNGEPRLAIEGTANGLQGNGDNTEAVTKSNGDTDLATAPNGAVATAGSGYASSGTSTGASSPDNSSSLPPKTRADIAQLVAGCRSVLQSFEALLDEHRGMNDIPTKPKGRGGGSGIMQLFAGRPSGVIDRYHFAQDGVQKVNAIRAKLTYHTGAITLMLTVLGSSSLGRIEGSLSKLETMIAAAAEERERVHTNNVNYYLLAQQNNLNLTPEKQEYLRQRQQKGMGMGPLEFQTLTEQEYYASMNKFSGMRRDGRPKLLKAKGDKQSSGFWGGGNTDPDDFFTNINSWTGRPKSSGNLQPFGAKASKEKERHKELGFLSSFGRRNTATSAEISMGAGTSSDNKKKKSIDLGESYLHSQWSESRKRKSATKSQRLMLPIGSLRNRHTESEEKESRDEKIGGREVKSSSSKRKEMGEGKKEEKVRKRRSKDEGDSSKRVVEEVSGDEQEIEVEENRNNSEPFPEPQRIGNTAAEGAAGPESEKMSTTSEKSKNSSRIGKEKAENDGQQHPEKHRRRKENERERAKASRSSPSKSAQPSSNSAAATPAILPSSAKQPKKPGLGESYFINSWEKSEKKKPLKPIVAIPVPRKKTSVVSMRKASSKGARSEDAKHKSKSKHSTASISLAEKEKKRQRKERRLREKEREGENGDLSMIAEEGSARIVAEAKHDDSTAEDKKNGNQTQLDKTSGEHAATSRPAENVNDDKPTPETEEAKGTTGEIGDLGQVLESIDTAALDEDEAAKKERRRRRKEAKEAEEKDGDKKHRPSQHRHNSHHRSNKDRSEHSSSKPTEKHRDKEKEKDRKEKPRRRDTLPVEEKKEHNSKSRSQTTPVMDKKGMVYDDRDVEARRKLKAEKEREIAAAATAQSQTNSAWGKAALGLVRMTMGGQKPEESKKKSKL